MIHGLSKTIKVISCLGLFLGMPLISCVSAQSIRLSNSELEDLHEFAIDYLDQVQPRSIRDGVEYCGLFGYDIRGRLSATQARKGKVDSCRPHNEPRGFTVLASYHTHGSFTMDADTEVPSEDDLLGDIQEQIYGYVATPSGRVWFNDWETREAFMLGGKGTISGDPHFRDCLAFMPRTQYTVPELIRRADEDTGEC